ncbi:hypothetical protein AO068_12760 [Pseudomonas sp. ICMP 3272]|nr:hypothetical protein AO068_12760 [Pseudomonas sp. ICMP 3272]
MIGLKDGLADSGLTSLDSAAQLVAHPIESFAAVKDFVESASGRQLLGAASDALALQLAKINTALQEGGDENAEQLGTTMGQAISIVVGALAGGQTNTAKAAAELSRMGIDLSSSALKTAAASYKASSLEKKLAKLESAGRDLDVPDAPEMPGDSVSSSLDTVRDGAKGKTALNEPNSRPVAENGGAPSTQTETYFRVESGGSGFQTSQNRITVKSDGTVSIDSGCSGQLCVSTNGPSHAAYYLSNKRPDGNVVVFEVDQSLHQKIMSEAIDQRPLPGQIRNPNAPKIVDPNQGKPSVSLELPKVWDSLLEKHSSNARVLTQEEFFHEFGR